MKKFLIIILFALAVLLCWYYFVLDEKERLLLSITSDKVDYLHSFKAFPIEYDEYEAFLTYSNDNEELGKLIVINEEWTKETEDVVIDIRLYSSFFKNSNQTLITLNQGNVFKNYEVVKVLNQKGYYNNFQDEHIEEEFGKTIYSYYEELHFDLEGITYNFHIFRTSTSNSLEPFGADKLIGMFFTNYFEK